MALIRFETLQQYTRATEKNEERMFHTNELLEGVCTNVRQVLEKEGTAWCLRCDSSKCVINTKQWQ